MKKIGKLKLYNSNEIVDSCVSIGFECLDRELFKPEKCYDALAKTGVKYARCQTGWSKCEKEKGIYDFSWLDSVVENLTSRGIIPWFNVGFGNPVYMPNVPNETAVGCVPIYYGDEAVAAWENFVSAVAKRYGNVVKHYEIWNEPNIKCFWYPEDPDAKEYADFVNRTAKVIKKVQHDAKIGVNINTPTDFGYADVLIENLEMLDFFAVHTYSKVPEYRYSSAISRLRRKLDSCGFKNTEIWQGEGGYPSWAYKGHWLVKDGCDDERAQAVWQLRRYFLDVANGIKRSSFFQMADMWEKPYAKATDVINKPAAHGILNGLTYTPKKSYETISNLAAIFSGDIKPSDEFAAVDVNSPTPLEMCACQTMTFRKNGTPVYAYYLPTSVAAKAEIPYKASLNTERLNDPVLIDTFTGEIFELDAPQQMKGTVRYNDLPLTDYPIIVTEREVFEVM